MTAGGGQGELRLERLWAVHEIRQLAYRYALAMDARDVDLYLSLWDETEVPLAYPDLDIHLVRRDLDRIFRKGPTILFVGNHLIDFDAEDRAHGSVYCWVQTDLGASFVDQMILYEDRYVRRADGWLFESRRHLQWFGQERERHPLHQPPSGWPDGRVGRGTVPESFPSYRAFVESGGGLAP